MAVLRLVEADRRESALDSGALGGVARRMGAQLVTEDLEEIDVPAFLGEFRVLRRIGAGGMGIVYAAEQAHPRRKVAIKTVHRWLRSPSDLRRFRQEVQAMGSLLHPAIPQVHETFEHDGAPYLVMELVEGGPVDRVTREPANVLVDPLGRPKLLDFGLARSLSGDRSGGGTVGFTSPGQTAAPALPPDARTDVFSLGRVGQVLFPVGHRDLRAILDKATAPDRDQRYATARALREDLLRHLAHEPVAARPSTPLYRL